MGHFQDDNVAHLDLMPIKYRETGEWMLDWGKEGPFFVVACHKSVTISKLYLVDHHVSHLCRFKCHSSI